MNVVKGYLIFIDTHNSWKYVRVLKKSVPYRLMSLEPNPSKQEAQAFLYEATYKLTRWKLPGTSMHKGYLEQVGAK